MIDSRDVMAEIIWDYQEENWNLKEEVANLKKSLENTSVNFSKENKSVKVMNLEDRVEDLEEEMKEMKLEMTADSRRRRGNNLSYHSGMVYEVKNKEEPIELVKTNIDDDAIEK